MDNYLNNRSNHWVRRISGAATVVMVVWVFAGWALDKGWTLEGMMLASMSGVLQALAWNASAQMRRASAQGVKDARDFWRATLIVCASWTAFSAHHAYGVIAGGPNVPPLSFIGVASWAHDAAALVLLTAWAFIEPLLGWAIEKTETSAPSASAQIAPTRARARPPRARRVVSGIAAAVALASGAAEAEPPLAGALAETASQDVPSARARALALFASGERNAAAIARALGLPQSTVRRWIATER